MMFRASTKNMWDDIREPPQIIKRDLFLTTNLFLYPDKPLYFSENKGYWIKGLPNNEQSANRNRLTESV